MILLMVLRMCSLSWRTLWALKRRTNEARRSLDPKEQKEYDEGGIRLIMEKMGANR